MTMSDVSAALDPRRFRDTIGLFATGVAVIVARAGDEVLAMTANAVSSASLDPMLVLFCPGKRTRFAQALPDLSGFTINFLRHEQQALSTYFAGGWREPAPPAFRLVPSRCAPRLEGSLASIGCELERVTEMGDHWLVVGRVVDLHIGVVPHRPLLFFSGRYRNVDPSESAPAPDLTSVQDEPAHVFYDRWAH
jgi:3-hydroxy-9,10-secoandrosta-1,3,5(10)-triene-9,17-dione monooxygenase reductase component